MLGLWYLLDSIKCPRSINARLLWSSKYGLVMGRSHSICQCDIYGSVSGWRLLLNCYAKNFYLHCVVAGHEASFLINFQSLIDGICVQVIYSGIYGICLVFFIKLYSVFGQIDSEVEWCIVMVQMSSNEPNEWWRRCWCAERSCSCWVQHGWHWTDGNR